MRKPHLTAAAALTIAWLLSMAITAGLGAYVIYSDTLVITIEEYTIMLNGPGTGVKYKTVLLNGIVELGANPVSNQEVILYQRTETFDWLAINSTFTDSTGHYAFYQNMTDTGPIYLRTGATIP